MTVVPEPGRDRMLSRAADDLGSLGHRQQAVAAHLVAAQRMLERVETHSVVDDFEPGDIAGISRRRRRR